MIVDDCLHSRIYSIASNIESIQLISRATKQQKCITMQSNGAKILANSSIPIGTLPLERLDLLVTVVLVGFVVSQSRCMHVCHSSNRHMLSALANDGVSLRRPCAQESNGMRQIRNINHVWYRQAR